MPRLGIAVGVHSRKAVSLLGDQDTHIPCGGGLQETPALAATKPISKSSGFPDQLVALVVIHEPSAQTHVTRMIPNATVLLLLALLPRRMLLNKRRSAHLLLYKCKTSERKHNARLGV